MADGLVDKVYLGDSVYASWEDNMLKLTTENGYRDDPSNVIFLEPPVLQNLIDYLKNSGVL